MFILNDKKFYRDARDALDHTILTAYIIRSILVVWLLTSLSEKCFLAVLDVI